MALRAVSPRVFGTTTNNNAASGEIGQYIESEVLIASKVMLTTATAADVTSISLTAGDWDVDGVVGWGPDAGTTMTLLAGYCTDVSATLATIPNKGSLFRYNTSWTASAAMGMPTGTRRFSLASTTTIYLGAYAVFAVNTMGAYGIIRARRVR
jgi:hypothetical protein